MEGRHTRRLVRYWIFLALAYLIGIGFYFYYGTLHAFFSSISASVGLLGPRFLMSVIGLYYLTGFVLGIVFLGFDVRARDIREGIVEVLDSRPLTNLELVAGRFAALFLHAWVPIVILVVVVQVLGWLLPMLGSPIGRTVEPLSLVTFAVFVSAPAIAFAIALVFVITLLVRHRLIAALLSIAAVFGLYFALFTAPATAAPFVDYLGVYHVGNPSDIVPELLPMEGVFQRLGFLLLALGLVGIAAAIHPRLDGGRPSRLAAASVGLSLAGVLSLGLVMQQRGAAWAEIQQWRSAHEARAAQPAADIVAIRGAVDIEPGRRLDAELTLDLEAPRDGELDRLLLTLNPGLVVEEIATADGRSLEFGHENGLLDIELPRALGPGERTALMLRYGGRPHTGFGYLDSSIDVEILNMNDAQIGILGYERGIFDSRYVALMPGIRWLPATGAEIGRSDPRKRRKDFFDIALDVSLPLSWTAAGPGKRRAPDADGDRATYRFEPRASVPEVALLAGELERFATEIDGITFELLLHPAHTGNLEILAHAREEVEQWIADRLDAAAAAGLSYPFDAFTVVEVPNTLRGYAGGWRLDTTLAPPTMMLLRETSFPTARFDFDVREVIGNRDPDRVEGGRARVDRDRLVEFFAGDLSGGNLFTGAARSFFAHRTAAFGDEAIALDFVLEQLATLLVSDQRSYFSAHVFENMNAAANNVVAGLQNDGSSFADAMISVQTSRQEVWTSALDAPLARIDPWQDPQVTIDVLTLKGGEMAQAIYDTLGPQAVGELLAGLLERRAGETFTLADVAAVGASVNDDLGPLLEDWVNVTGLPGFVAENVELFRLPDEGDGARFQLLVRVANLEPTVGFARVAWSMERGGERTLSDPIRIPGRSAMEFGAVLAEQPAIVHVHPYLSLNRRDFMAAIVDTVEARTRDVEPFEGVREAVSAPGDDRIVADDLDETFSIVEGEAEQDLRLAGRDTPDASDLDEGLPIATGSQPPRTWSRRTNETAWGTYRHTTTYVGAGDGNRKALMPVTIPAPGVWELEIHVPYFAFLAAEDRGTWNLEVVSSAGREPVTYDARAADFGWNLVGEFYLPAGEVTVEITDRTDGRMVIADAVAWSPLRVESDADETSQAGSE